MSINTDPSQAKVPVEPTGDCLPLRILLAEDNHVNRMVVLLLLQRLGYQADIAGNGLEALNALRRQHYDVVFMDVQMPEMDGLTATRQILREWSPEVRPRIIAVTANAMQSDRDECFAAGVDDCISKPIRVEALAEALEKCRLIPASSDSDEAALSQEQAMPNESVPLAELDLSALQDLRRITGEDDLELMGELIHEYLQQVPEFIHMLRASAVQDMVTLRRTAHRLKANSLSFGAIALATLCQELELRGETSSYDAILHKIDAVEAEFIRVQAALETYQRSCYSNPR